MFVPLALSPCSLRVVAVVQDHLTVGSSSAPSSSPAASPSPSPASQSQLQKIVLSRPDLPAGWKGTPYQPAPDRCCLPGCLGEIVGARNTDRDKVAEAHASAGLGVGSICVLCEQLPVAKRPGYRHRDTEQPQDLGFVTSVCSASCWRPRCRPAPRLIRRRSDHAGGWWRQCCRDRSGRDQGQSERPAGRGVR